MNKILIVDDDKDVLESLSEMLGSAGYHIDSSNSAKKALALVEKNKYSIVISDIQMPGEDGIWLLKKIDKKSPVVLMTAYGTIDRAVESIKLGAKDFITKPFKKIDIIRAIEEHKTTTIVEDMVVEDESMILIRDEIDSVGNKKVPFLLTGESGVGKDVIANYIHRSSKRKGKFVAVNCASIPDGMLESILFGYEKGAFTGAHKKHDGKFIRADGGTLFLDEIGEMDLELQAKLLRVLETGLVDTIGGVKETPIDLNLVVATNADLAQKISDKEFRLDLYYRINVMELAIPPLKDRPLDLQMLTSQFIEKYSIEYDKKLTINEKAKDKIRMYEWPGNIRELKNVIQRACIVADGEISENEIRVMAKDISLEGALEKFAGNRKKTAEYLGISIRTLQYKIKQSGLIGK